MYWNTWIKFGQNLSHTLHEVSFIKQEMNTVVRLQSGKYLINDSVANFISTLIHCCLSEVCQLEIIIKILQVMNTVVEFQVGTQWVLICFWLWGVPAWTVFNRIYKKFKYDSKPYIATHIIHAATTGMQYCNVFDRKHIHWIALKTPFVMIGSQISHRPWKVWYFAAKKDIVLH